MGSTRGHWEDVYASKADTAVSWYQPHAARSFAMIVSAEPDRGSPIIDIGGGTSTLVDDLLAAGYTDLTVLDIADTALAKAKARLGRDQARVSWVVADITRWRPARTYQVWHDRAVFHFLTDDTRQDAYIAALHAGTHPGSAVIISTFALDGPDKCSGLPVQRYSATTLAKRLGPTFALVGQASETHKTPWGSGQRFSYAAFRRAAPREQPTGRDEAADVKAAAPRT
jgi:SAM-dependent methyltransferase